MSAIKVRLVAGLFFLALLALAQNTSSKAGQGWMPEFNHAASQLDALAEATPAEKFSWRPAPGVRSVSEVYMHIAIGNYFLLGQAGVKLPPEIASKAKPESEKTVTEKADVIKFLKESQDLVRDSYPKADLQKKAKFFEIGRASCRERV